MSDDTPLHRQQREDFANLVAPFYAIFSLDPPTHPDGPPTIVAETFTDPVEFDRAVERALLQGTGYKFCKCTPLEYSLKLYKGPGT